jgi:hypothetical protein
VRALLLAALLALGGCEFDEPIIAWGTVVSVQEKEAVESLDDSGKHYEHPLVPELAWKLEVRLDDGATIVHDSSRRHAPGERVAVLIPVAHALPQD